MCLGAKEIDIAATLEHIRDQRINMVRSKVRRVLSLLADLSAALMPAAVNAETNQLMCSDFINVSSHHIAMAVIVVYVSSALQSHR